MYQQDIEQLIKERISVRNYADQQASSKQVEDLMAFAKSLETPHYRFEMVDFEVGSKERLATYGFIKNAKKYLVGIGSGAMATEKNLAIQFGYDFEKIVLKATDLGLATCWIGASYKEKEILTLVEGKEGERVLMLTPIGLKASKHLGERIIRGAIKADKRKDFGDLFFKNALDQPLKKDPSNPYHELLDLVRLAPSAGNVQPWRVVEHEIGYDFYARGAKMYENMKDKRISLTHNDMGIAKLHFELGARRHGMTGSWVIKDQLGKEEKGDYCYTWLCN